MKIEIDRIVVDETSRIRQDIGDFADLQQSIAEVGLINPILVDEQDRLIAGYRRLSACRNLGWKEIEVNVVELEDDELKMLEAEAAENMFRKDFTPDEILAIQKRREEIEEARRPKGLFERFMIWLKALFAPKPEVEDGAAEKEKAVTPQVDAAQAEPAASDSTGEDGAGATTENTTTEDASAAEKTVEERPESPTTGDIPSGSAAEADGKPQRASGDMNILKQPSSAEIVEENGVRHIKWR